MGAIGDTGAIETIRLRGAIEAIGSMGLWGL